MSLNRRQFVTVATSSIALTVLNNLAPWTSHSHAEVRVQENKLAKEPFDAGPVSKFTTAGVYGEFLREKGIWVVSDGKMIYALNAGCTHRGVAVNWKEDKFACSGHGASFNIKGQCTGGPGTHFPPPPVAHQAVRKFDDAVETKSPLRPLERCAIGFDKDDKTHVRIDPTRRFGKEEEWTKSDVFLAIPTA